MSVVSSYRSSHNQSAPVALSFEGQALRVLPNGLERRLEEEGVRELSLARNLLSPLPPEIGTFSGLKKLDVSSNALGELTEELCSLEGLEVLVAKRNQIHGLPKNFGRLGRLRELNLSGNRLDHIPQQVLGLVTLEVLHLGGNQIRSVPSGIGQLTELTFLYLGGNRLRQVPPDLGHLDKLSALVLCDNQLRSLPPELTELTRLQSLRLHNNQLETLPKDLVKLTHLQELSLRGNPLVLRFVREWVDSVPSLLELSARCVMNHRVPYDPTRLPGRLPEYLRSAQRCDNPRCNGVYFQSRVQHVKFVDFCGKYRVPLMQYICSPVCAGDESSGCSSEEEEADAQHRMKKVLLG